MLSHFVLLATLLTSIHAANQGACNGYTEFCNKPYNSLTYVLTHNAYAFSSNVAANQMCPVGDQLADGVRGLKLSAIDLNNSKEPNNNITENSIYLCHTACAILNGGPAVETLGNLTEWLKNNPNEVLTISWNNLAGFSVEAFEAAYKASGLLDYIYTQPVGNYTWPTLQEMIDSNKRVVNFVDTGANQEALPWLMDEFAYVFETPYDNRNESEFSCVIDRPDEPASPEQMMYIMNHFLYGAISIGKMSIELPQKGTSNVTNADSLLKQAKSCTSTFGRQPNFLEVDFYNLGTTLQIAAELNNVTYIAKELQCDDYFEAASTTQLAASSGTIYDLRFGTTFYLILSLFVTIVFSL